MPRDAVLQLFAPECVDVVPGLLASVRPPSRSLRGIGTSRTHPFVLDHHRNRERDGGSDSHQLEHNPNAFLSQTYTFTEISSEDGKASSRMELPTYVVAYSTIESKISGVLRRGHYIEVRWNPCTCPRFGLWVDVAFRRLMPLVGVPMPTLRSMQEASFVHSETSGDADSSEFAARMLVYKRQ